jgi:hypothetical protein
MPWVPNNCGRKFVVLHTRCVQQQVAAALGYVAHMVHLMAEYQDVPLRYPVRPRLSSSYVQDYTPLPQAPAPQPGGVVVVATILLSLCMDKRTACKSV